MVPVSKWSPLICQGEGNVAKTRYELYGTREFISLSGVGARALTNAGRRVNVVSIRNLRMRHERFPREIQYGQDSMHIYLDKIFGSRIRAKLIGWLFSHTEEKFFVSQLAELLDEKNASISRELSRLTQAGILLSNREGKRKNFQANPSFFFFPELKRLVLKTVGVPGQLSQLLSHLSGVRHAFLYGPYGRGDEEAGSDIDLMLIGDIDCDMLDELLEGLENRLALTVTCMVYGPEEFDEKVKTGNRFLLDVLEDDFIMLVGRRDDLAIT